MSLEEHINSPTVCSETGFCSCGFSEGEVELRHFVHRRKDGSSLEMFLRFPERFIRMNSGGDTKNQISLQPDFCKAVKLGEGNVLHK